MLHYSTVGPRTLDVLKHLMSLPVLADFQLVGGTALALYYGHRLSIDLDLFSTQDFIAEEVVSVLEREFLEFTYSRPNAIGIFGFIGEIKVDLVRYHYHPVIGAAVEIDGIRLASKEDLMAMKLAAILKRGVKKDFWDISELLKHYDIDYLIDCYYKKYPSHQMLISIPQAITFFVDADDSEDPVSLKGQNWNGVKKNIKKKVSKYLK